MKKLFVLCLCLFFIPAFAFAEDDEWGSVYDNLKEFEKPVPAVTDKEFNDVIKSKMGKKKKNKNSYENIQAHDMSSLTDLEETYPSILVMQKFYTDDNKIIDEGYYKAVVSIPKNKYEKHYVHFFQGHTHKGKIRMYETNNDYDEPEINYAKIIEENGTLKFIYGNIDCNLEGNLVKVR